jgi:SP family arabinose:H+ symporter-like MFS transporter
MNNRFSTPHESESGSILYLSLICLVASLGGLLFGFDTAVISGTVSLVEVQFGLSKLEVGWFTSSALVGCILGAVFAGSLGDRYGRKPVLVFAGMLFLVSGVGSAIPPSFSALILARLVCGIGVGIASVLSPLYITEFAPPHIRGRLVAFYQFSIVTGILLAYFSNWLLQTWSVQHTGAFGDSGILHRILITEVWRSMFGMETIPALLFLLLLAGVPESPRWLIQQKKEDKGRSILQKISGTETAEREFEEIRESLQHKKGTVRELLQPGLRTALIAGIGLSVFGQLTGVNAVIYYGPLILEQAGIQFGSALQFQIMLGLINLVFTVLAMLVIDKLGRRPLLIGGMIMVVITLVLAGILFSSGSPNGKLIVAVLGAYIAFIAFSICAVIWVLTPEIFPNRVRGRAMSIATFSNWLTNTLAAYLFPWYVSTYGMHVGFFTFAGICAIATVFFWKFVPETRGKSLEQIELMFMK